MKKSILLLLLCALSIAAGLAEPPRRVISVAPSLTDLVQAILAEESLVGISDYCVWESDVPEPPRIGKTLAPSKEEILRLKPDMVLVYREQQGLITFLKEAGIPYLAFAHTTIGDIYDTLYRLGELFGREAEAADKVREIGSLLLRLERNTEVPDVPPRVLIIVGREPGSLKNIYAVGHGDFLSELLESLGAENAYEGSLAYPRFSIEGIAALDPDLIIEILPDLARAVGTEALKKDWKAGAPFLRAVRNGKVKEAPPGLRVEPSTEVIPLAHTLKEMIYAD
ncbi:MAG TPA: helical backbone metal receptor [Candidatus Mcinerneyibacteriales bacterium]|nr:helical backbone metal receptor [Candidatus Mcinerneyibacteriales bacterium]